MMWNILVNLLVLQLIKKLVLGVTYYSSTMGEFELGDTGALPLCYIRYYECNPLFQIQVDFVQLRVYCIIYVMVNYKIFMNRYWKRIRIVFVIITSNNKLNTYLYALFHSGTICDSTSPRGKWQVESMNEGNQLLHTSRVLVAPTILAHKTIIYYCDIP